MSIYFKVGYRHTHVCLVWERFCLNPRYIVYRIIIHLVWNVHTDLHTHTHVIEYSVIKDSHHHVPSNLYNKSILHCFSSLICKARAYISWFGMMPESYFNSWALSIIINHHDDVLFNIHGHLQQFLLAVSLNRWIGSRTVTTLCRWRNKRHREKRDFWFTQRIIGIAGMKTHNLLYLYSDTEAVLINFHIKSFSYIWETKKVPLSNSIRHIICSQ